MSGKITKGQRSTPVGNTRKGQRSTPVRNTRKRLRSTPTRITRKRLRSIPTRSTGSNSTRITGPKRQRSTPTRGAPKRSRAQTKRFSPPEEPREKKKLPNPNGKYTKDSFEKMMYAIASVFISNKTFANKLTSINELLIGELGKKVREVLTGGSTPDTECKNARKRAEKNRHTSAPAIDYKHITERKNGLLTSKVKGIKTHTRGKNDEGNLIKIEFLAKKKGYCGKCWMCGLDVNYYLGDEFVTSCGECEHIGAITASFLTGMLTSADLDVMSYNYGTSHVHCNQRKWHIISMKFDNNALWKYDIDGAQKIAGKIVNSKMHDTEYDTIFKNKFAEKLKKKVLFTQQIIGNIEGVTNVWCEQANNSIVGVEDPKKRLKGFKLTELARKITIELMEQTKKYQDFITKGGTTPMLISNGSPNNNQTVIDNKVIEHKAQPPPALVTPVELMTEIYEEQLKKTFKEKFGEKLLNLLIKFQTEQDDNNAEYRDDFKKNLDTALQNIERLNELNIALKEFHSQE